MKSFNIELLFSARDKLSKMKKHHTNVAASYDRSKSSRFDVNERHIEKIQNSSEIIKKEKLAEGSKLLKLAMNWNCVQIAREFIFRNSLNNVLVLILIKY